MKSMDSPGNPFKLLPFHSSPGRFSSAGLTSTPWRPSFVSPPHSAPSTTILHNARDDSKERNLNLEILKLKAEMEQNQVKEQEAKIEWESQKCKYEASLNKCQQKIQELEKGRRILFASEKELKEKLELQDEQILHKEKDYENKIAQMRAHLTSISDELEEQRWASSSKRRRLSTHSMKMNGEEMQFSHTDTEGAEGEFSSQDEEMCDNEADSQFHKTRLREHEARNDDGKMRVGKSCVVLEAQVENLRQQQQESSERIQKLVEELFFKDEIISNLNIKIDNMQISSPQSSSKEQLQMIIDLEKKLLIQSKENGKLRSQLENVEILREKYRSLERQMGRISDLKDQLDKTQTQLSMVVTQAEYLGHLEARAKAECGCSSIEDLFKLLMVKEFETLQLKEQIGSLEASILEASKRPVIESSDQIKTLEQERDQLKDKMMKDQQTRKKFVQLIHLYRSYLDECKSFQIEFMTSHNKDELSPRLASLLQQFSDQIDKISTLSTP